MTSYEIHTLNGGFYFDSHTLLFLFDLFLEARAEILEKIYLGGGGPEILKMCLPNIWMVPKPSFGTMPTRESAKRDTEKSTAAVINQVFLLQRVISIKPKKLYCITVY